MTGFAWAADDGQGRRRTGDATGAILLVARRFPIEASHKLLKAE